MLGKFRISFYDAHDLQNVLLKKHIPFEIEELSNISQIGMQIISDPNDEDNYLVRVDLFDGLKAKIFGYLQLKPDFKCKQTYIDIGIPHEI